MKKKNKYCIQNHIKSHLGTKCSYLFKNSNNFVKIIITQNYSFFTYYKYEISIKSY